LQTWSRSGSADFENFKFRVKLSPTQWFTPGSPREPGHDLGGEVSIVKDIANAVAENETFQAYTVERRATRTFFVPEIVIRDEIIPEHYTGEVTIQQLALGPQYDMFISFGSKAEATLFNLTFRGGGVSVGFDGIN
jgi:hypothetical protein